MSRERPWHLLIAAVSVAVSTVFFIDLCNAIYLCGCDHLWAGAADRCNIHQPAGKHCPWCAMPLSMVTGVYFGIVAPQVFVALRPAQWSRWRRFSLTLALFPLIGGVQALVIGWMTGYWD